MQFPGLIKECKNIAKELNITDELETMDIKNFKNLVNTKIHSYNEKILRLEMKKGSKLLHKIDEQYELKNYFKELRVEEVRLKFRLETKMVDAKFNFKNKKNYARELWQCDSCENAIESQSHLLWCPAYQQLREGKDLKNDKHLINYIKKVLEIREKLSLKR